VLDALVIAQVQKLGVRVLQGTRVDLAASHIEAERSVIEARIGRRALRIGCRWVVDATGSSASLARQHGLWSDDGVAFQSHALWAAFEGVKPWSAHALPQTTQSPRDE